MFVSIMDQTHYWVVRKEYSRCRKKQWHWNRSEKETQLASKPPGEAIKNNGFSNAFKTWYANCPRLSVMNVNFMKVNPLDAFGKYIATFSCPLYILKDKVGPNLRNVTMAWERKKQIRTSRWQRLMKNIHPNFKTINGKSITLFDRI